MSVHDYVYSAAGRRNVGHGPYTKSVNVYVPPSLLTYALIHVFIRRVGQLLINDIH